MFYVKIMYKFYLEIQSDNKNNYAYQNFRIIHYKKEDNIT